MRKSYCGRLLNNNRPFLKIHFRYEPPAIVVVYTLLSRGQHLLASEAQDWWPTGRLAYWPRPNASRVDGVALGQHQFLNALTAVAGDELEIAVNV